MLSIEDAKKQIIFNESLILAQMNAGGVPHASRAKRLSFDSSDEDFVTERGRRVTLGNPASYRGITVRNDC